MSELPIASIKSAFVNASALSPVVVTSPTGSGKSTEVPRWCEGPVLVVEPRRIACRSLASRVAELEGTALGDVVGYVVRDERVASPGTRIVFATPGVVLRSLALLEGARTVILDEFHERSLDVDFLLALLLRRRAAALAGGGALAASDASARAQRLIVMSATLDGARIADHVQGVHLAAEGRAYPVDVRYTERGDALPDAEGLPARVRRAVVGAAQDAGDILVFLPGKSEIDSCKSVLGDGPYTLVPLHGGLTLDEQRQAFESAPRRKVILATNVAETSLTLPGVGVVIDTGLVRQTRYHDGRGFLALGPIAIDSADQRAGRAGRTAPGVCYRLWSPLARLAAKTLPEIYRESLVPFVLAAAAWNQPIETLPLLDSAKPYALQAARDDLKTWGALDNELRLTAGGRALFALPLDAPLARLLLESEKHDCVEDAIDLVAALAVGRPMFVPGSASHESEARHELRLAGCDAVALIRAVRLTSDHAARLHGVSGFVLAEARRIRRRLREQWGFASAESTPGRETQSGPPAAEREIRREALARAAMTADARVAHVARPRGRETMFSNGGTELALARESAVRNVRDVEAVVVFDSRAFGAGRDTQVVITCATAIPLKWIAQQNLGRDQLGAVRFENGRVAAQVEHVYAKRVVAVRDEVPKGELARRAVAELFERGSLFRDTLVATRERLARTALAEQVATREHGAARASAGARLPLDPRERLRTWVLARLAALGVESGDDLALLSSADLLAPDVPFEQKALLDRDFPAKVSVGDAHYEAEYDLAAGQVVLRMVKGTRRDPPPLAYLPRFAGLRITVDSPRGMTVIRQRG